MAPEGVMVDSYRGAGCENCFNTGFKGRVGIFEMMDMNDELRNLILAKSDAMHLMAAARRSGMRTLREDGWAKVPAGITTADEVLRVTQEL
jgi:type II secretory ATPase GspE/PulE/Tfp pilus assembly ATPase PilB-like protein